MKRGETQTFESNRTPNDVSCRASTRNTHGLNTPQKGAVNMTRSELGEVKDKIMEVLRVFNGRVFTAEELRVAIFPRYSIKTIRDAMWDLNDEGKAKLWVRLP